MNDQQIDYFMAVATNLSFTKTSEELYVSQPAISRHISQLEKELGVKLFIRNNKSTKLTEEGKLYYNYFRDSKIKLRNIQIKTTQIQRKNAHTLKLGLLEGWNTDWFLPELLKEYKSKNLNVEICIDCCGIKEISTLLLTGGLDIAMTFKNSVSKIEEIECDDVAKVDKMLIYSEQNTLANKNDLRPVDFRNEIFYAPSRIEKDEVARILDSYCLEQGFMPKLEFVHNNETMYMCVKNNMGVGITDKWSWSLNADDIKSLNMNCQDTVTIAKIQNYDNSFADELAEILARIIRKKTSDANTIHR